MPSDGKDRFRKELAKALESGNDELLQTAVEKAKKGRLPDNDLHLYALELRKRLAKKKATEGLEKAIASRNIKVLRSTLGTAQRAGLTKVERQEAQKVLEEEEEKFAAHAEVLKVLESGGGDALQKALKRADDANVPGQKLTEAYSILEVRLAAESSLVKACEFMDVQQITAALEHAKVAKASAEHLSVGQQALEMVLERIAATENLQAALHSPYDASRSSRVQEAVTRAERAGVLSIDFLGSALSMEQRGLSEVLDLENQRAEAWSCFEDAKEMQDAEKLQQAIDMGMDAELPIEVILDWRKVFLAAGCDGLRQLVEYEKELQQRLDGLENAALRYQKRKQQLREHMDVAQRSHFTRLTGDPEQWGAARLEELYQEEELRLTKRQQGSPDKSLASALQHCDLSRQHRLRGEANLNKARIDLRAAELNHRYNQSLQRRQLDMLGGVAMAARHGAVQARCDEKNISRLDQQLEHLRMRQEKAEQQRTEAFLAMSLQNVHNRNPVLAVV